MHGVLCEFWEDDGYSYYLLFIGKFLKVTDESYKSSDIMSARWVHAGHTRHIKISFSIWSILHITTVQLISLLPSIIQHK